MTEWDAILERTGRYYASKAREHGATARGVDWNSEASQRTRFDQFARLLDDPAPGAPPLASAPRTSPLAPRFSVNDYGCGYGALVEWLGGAGRSYRYHGFDLAPEMIALARERHAGNAACRFTSSAADLAVADYTVASGIFNVKQDTPAAEWDAYVFDVIERMAALSRSGFAFNILTLDSDPARRRDD